MVRTVICQDNAPKLRKLFVTTAKAKVICLETVLNHQSRADQGVADGATEEVHEIEVDTELASNVEEEAISKEIVLILQVVVLLKQLI